jgi:hypothetical protein
MKVIWHIAIYWLGLPFLFSTRRSLLCSLDNFRCSHTRSWYMSRHSLFMRCRSVRIWSVIRKIQYISRFEGYTKFLCWRPGTGAVHLSRPSVTRIWSSNSAYMSDRWIWKFCQVFIFEDSAQVLRTYPGPRWLGFEARIKLICWVVGFESQLKLKKILENPRCPYLG